MGAGEDHHTYTEQSVVLVSSMLSSLLCRPLIGLVYMCVHPCCQQAPHSFGGGACFVGSLVLLAMNCPNSLDTYPVIHSRRIRIPIPWTHATRTHSYVGLVADGRGGKSQKNKCVLYQLKSRRDIGSRSYCAV